LRRALELSRGRARAPVALAAARIALAAGQAPEALKLFEECLTFDSANPVALAGRAALLWESGSFAELARMADRLAELSAEDPWLHFLVAVGAFVAGKDDLAAERAAICATQPETLAEGHHLLALLNIRRGKSADARVALRHAIDAPAGPTADHARALRGQLAWRAGDYADALRTWQPIAPA